MKLLALLLLVTFSNATISSNNNDRYVWLSGHSPHLHLVDLHEPVKIDASRSGAGNQYWLFTRSNPTTPQFLIHGNVNSIINSNYAPNRQTKVLVHGWNGNGNHRMNNEIASAYFDRGDFNIIVVDWNRIANMNYVSAVAGVPNVGENLGNFLAWFFNTIGGSWNDLHLIGFSLGAHVVGNAGRAVGGRAARITGLDPAGPLWTMNRNALTLTDGVYVESIHTDGRLQGIFNPISDADFYPNGGRHPQPGCSNSNCSHSRAIFLFSSSVRTDHFIGRQCTDINQAQSMECNGSSFNMGNSIINKKGRGLFGLRTGSAWPF